MKQDNYDRFVIEKFRQQRKSQLKNLVVMAALILAIALSWLAEWATPAMADNSAWRAWMYFLAIAFVIDLIIVLIFSIKNGECPACGIMLGQDFWLVSYCSHCGAQLRE